MDLLYLRSLKYASLQKPLKLEDEQQSLMNYLSYSLKAEEVGFPMSIGIKSREGKEYKDE